jgi:hypothetical protein
MDALTAALAVIVLKPMRRAWLHASKAIPTGALAEAD